jgi:hypothetical protein
MTLVELDEEDYEECDAENEFEPDSGKCMGCECIEWCNEYYFEKWLAEGEK